MNKWTSIFFNNTDLAFQRLSAGATKAVAAGRDSAGW